MGPLGVSVRRMVAGGVGGLTALGVDEHEDSSFGLLLGDELAGLQEQRPDLVVLPDVRDGLRVRRRGVEALHLLPQR